MDIPELATMVAQHLEASDLRSCALVRRTWYDNFNPFVWSTFVLNDVPAFEPSCYLLSSPMLSPSSPTLSIPPATMSHLECKAHPRCCKVNAVHKNADLIRHLIVRYVGPDCHPEEFYALFIEKCCSLQSLSFLVDGVYQEYTASLLRANPRICRQVSHFLLPEVTGPSSSAQGLQTRVLTIGGAR
ncbi:hypothetical protein DFQ27_003495 [Actinomortierella ambigua]|uniref:F-box domain-containing protein n=1 Tax=Actinomortierella ambigua TaxID=1343610 RepID=A0A9P6Q5R9_9FUNG|nr:hypothetical protein DFQ27_003495 [Actinomortierella ambigua]